jgi:hypothetical protein
MVVGFVFSPELNAFVFATEQTTVVIYLGASECVPAPVWFSI